MKSSCAPTSLCDLFGAQRGDNSDGNWGMPVSHGDVIADISTAWDLPSRAHDECDVGDRPARDH
jgi:hypothetical protein